MKSDLDQLMKEANLDALLVVGNASHNPAMTYFTGLVHVNDAYLLKKRGDPPILFYFTMERDEAASTGLKTKNLDDYDVEKLVGEANGDLLKARALRFRRIFEEYGVQGRTSLYGIGNVGSFYGIFKNLEQIQPDVELVFEDHAVSVLTRARNTKDETEVERIRKVGQITVNVVNDVANYLTSHQVKNGMLINHQGEPLTIGEVKRRIHLWLAMRGAESPESPIFAIGYDSAVPHSVGKDEQPVEIGKTIVFDIFPCEAGGGYFYDFTRTWCLGYAPDEVQRIYEDVLQVYGEVFRAITPNQLCRNFQILTCELFEARGHPTKLTNKRTEEGYVHSLAHGLGLEVHEGPSFKNEDYNQDILIPGSVITVEPGLYYPQHNIGVRLEDTVWVRPDGTLETLVEYPMDLVLKMPGV